MRSLSGGSFTVVLLLLAGCGGGAASEATEGSGGAGAETGAGGGETTTGAGGATTATPPAAATGDPANLPPMPEGLAGPPAAWDSMSGEDKGHWMADHVVPAMRPLFAAYDPTRYADVRCTTCHGASARERHFAMPNPDLPRLPAVSDSAGWAALQREQPRAMAFMASRVEHAMAALVGESPYDPATGQGFGCLECHTTTDAAAH